MTDEIQGLTAILSDRYRVERKIGAGHRMISPELAVHRPTGIRTALSRIGQTHIENPMVSSEALDMMLSKQLY